MDAVTDPSVRRITIMKAARVGYTRMLDNMVGYYVHQDPSPILIVQPTEDDARDYSDGEIAPMIRETPVLASIAGDMTARASKQKVDKRSFRNGASIYFVGANSPSGFRRITVRIVAFDEVDGYPAAGAGNEGDQIALGIKRTETFWNRKIILGSTPGVQGISRIEKSWEESDQRRYYVPCPHCGIKQTLKWENLKWDKTEAGEHMPETAYFRCVATGCGKRIEEHHKPEMIAKGEWIAEKPQSEHAGFHIWQAYSLFPNAAWRYIAKEWLDSYKDPLRKKPFFNLVLGLPYQEAVEVADPDALKQRCEPYNHETLPSDVKLITFGADTQDDRIEVTFVGWGAQSESWVARHEVLHGDTSKPYIWEQFDKLISEPCFTDEGKALMPQAGCIDSAGHRSEMVYKFCRDRKRRRIYATIGRGNPNPASPRMIWPKTASRTKNKGDKPYIVGVDTAKDDISSRLAIVPDPNNTTARAIHFPAVGLSGDYFEQLTSEHAVTTYGPNGRPRRSWETKAIGARNEAWDCLVLALAARLSLPVKLDKTPRTREAPKAETEAEAEAKPATRPVKAEPKQETERPQRRDRGRWGAYR